MNVFTHHKPRPISTNFLPGTGGNSSHTHFSHVSHFQKLQNSCIQTPIAFRVKRYESSQA